MEIGILSSKTPGFHENNCHARRAFSSDGFVECSCFRHDKPKRVDKS